MPFVKKYLKTDPNALSMNKYVQSDFFKGRDIEHLKSQQHNIRIDENKKTETAQKQLKKSGFVVHFGAG